VRGAGVRTLLALPLASVACSGEPLTGAAEEPIRVPRAELLEGALPGDEPLDPGAEPPVEDLKKPQVTSVSLGNRLIATGTPERALSGRVSKDAVAIATRLSNAGNGYWISPVGTPDPTNGGELTWNFRVEFSPTLEPGLHPLRFVAIDADGRAGRQREVELCVLRPFADNFNACDPTLEPNPAVLSLEWDSSADLDLRVVTPSGKIVDAKSPTTAPEDEEGNVTVRENDGKLDLDSNRACIQDSRRRENLVWTQRPARGTYLIYANAYSSCGAPATRFTVSLQVATAGSKPGTYTVKESFAEHGVLLAEQANSGQTLGTYVTQITF
jgi:hypothetical protein